MAGILHVSPGALVVAGISFDVVRTAIGFSGPGFINSRLAYILWRVGSRIVLGVERRTAASFLGALAPVILISVAAAWIVLHLLG